MSAVLVSLHVVRGHLRILQERKRCARYAAPQHRVSVTYMLRFAAGSDPCLQELSSQNSTYLSDKQRQKNTCFFVFGSPEWATIPEGLGKPFARRHASQSISFVVSLTTHAVLSIVTPSDPIVSCVGLTDQAGAMQRILYCPLPNPSPTAASCARRMLPRG